MDIIPTIDRFLKARMYHYALLINGEWGCGKTFFVKDTLMKHIKEELSRDVSYISLYGVKTTEEISQMLCFQSIKGRMGSAGTFVDTKGGQVFTTLLSAATKIGLGKIGADNNSVEDILTKIQNYDKSVIIFDDLERCNCSINEILGYINNFVEHTDASVILVANEEEIGNMRLNNNQELQMLFASDPRVMVEKFAGMKVNDKAALTKESKESYTPEEIERRRKIIFGHNDSYQRIKEKVIGVTIKYEPELRPIFKALIETKVKEQPLSTALLSMLDWFVMIAEKDNHKNLRTFQYFLEKASVLYDLIDDSYSNLYELLFRYTFRTSVRYMKGLPMPKWDGDYGEQKFYNGNLVNSDSEFGFRFVDDLILANIIAGNIVNEVLSRYIGIVNRKRNLGDDPYNLIQNLSGSTEKDMENWLIEIEGKVRNGFYSIELFTDLTRRIAVIKAQKKHIEQCDNVFNAMMDYVRSVEPSDIEDLERAHYELSELEENVYLEMYIQLTELINSIAEENKYPVDDLII